MEDKVGRVFLIMLLFIPLSFLSAHIFHNNILTFITSVLAIVPLSRILGFSAKEIALQTGTTFGGLVSVAFSNVTLIIIAMMALNRGLLEVVKAAIIGSIIVNILLVIGLAIFFGGWKYKEQKFNQNSAGVSSTMLIISIAGLTIPSVYAMTAISDSIHIQILSDAVAVSMAMVYIAGLFFSYFTHKYLFDASDEIKASHEKPTISRNKAALILVLATVFVAFESGLLIDTFQEAAKIMSLREFFLGAVVIAVITNISEKANAIHFALENKIDLSIEIGLSSAIQIALFVVPILVFVSQYFHYGFLLTFSMFEVVSVLLAVMIVNHLSADGKCNWLEGAQLIAVYMIIVAAFYFIA